MKKSINTLLLIFLFIIPYIHAQSGCFLYAKSPSYCQDIESNQAQIECAEFEDCNLNTALSISPCSTLITCQKILCKDTCTQVYAGLCPSGSLTPEEQDHWCSPGCCRIHYESGNVCTYLQTQSACEQQAKQQHASAFNYDSTLTQSTCQNYCTPLQDLTTNPFEKLSQQTTSDQQPSTPTTIPEQSFTKPNNQTIENLSTSLSNSTSSPTTTIVLATLTALALLGGGFLVYKKYLNHPKENLTQTKTKELTITTSDHNIPPLPSKQPITLSANTLKKQEREKDQVTLDLTFTNSQKTTKKRPTPTIRALDKLVLNHEIKKSGKPTPNTFDQLRSLSKKK